MSFMKMMDIMMENMLNSRAEKAAAEDHAEERQDQQDIHDRSL